MTAEERTAALARHLVAEAARRRRAEQTRQAWAPILRPPSRPPWWRRLFRRR